MGECLTICSDLSFTELLIQCTVKDIGNTLGGPCLAVLVSVGHFFCGGLIEEKCNEARYDWYVLEPLPWSSTFIASRFVAVREGTAVQHLVLSGVAAARVDTTVNVFRA